ncbi:MAG: hypothetical protein AMK73_04750 [Planctomycetes bacterium SM23_32]|nr:MAG: hypothetical protein AMK73_04750 [Planctomycetes bacterium SM23_32]
MITKVDAIGKIQELYMQQRPVPYVTFMHVFNGLLEDPLAVEPKEPSAGLEEKFRAACMAANVGLTDTEGREEKRLREFHRKVVPVWRQALAPEEFARFEEILGGAMRRRHGLAANGGARADEAARNRQRALLKKLGVDELEVEPQAGPPVLVADVKLPARLRVARRFGSVDELCAAIRSGAIEPEYHPRGKAGDFARYPLDGVDVALKLAEAEGRRYTVLTAGMGSDGLTYEPGAMDGAAAEMRYRRMADSAYMRAEGGLVYTLKVGPRRVSIACAAADGQSDLALVQRIETLHRDLGEVVERIKG